MTGVITKEKDDLAHHEYKGEVNNDEVDNYRLKESFREVMTKVL